MDIQVFVNTCVGHDRRTQLVEAEPSTRRLYEEVESETYTDSLIGTIFWQSLSASPAYLNTLICTGLSPEVITKSDSIIVSSEDPSFGCYDLLIFDPSHESEKPKVVEVKEDKENLREGWMRLKNQSEKQW